MDLCDRFHCLPSQLLKEDAGLLRLIEIVHLARPPAGSGEEEEAGDAAW